MSITHDPIRHEFSVIDSAGGAKAYLQYSLVGKGKGKTKKNVMDMFHTFVPPELRGQGIAAKLVEAGMQYAEAEQYEVLPTCSYISETFLLKHPQYLRLVRS